MQLSDYQQRSRATAVYPDAGDNLTYPALGLCGEAGECAEKVKKAIRDDGGVLSDERRAALAAELGDVLWYVAQLATEAGLDLDEIAEDNLAKLLSRQRPRRAPGLGRRALAVRVQQRLLPLEGEQQQVDHPEGAAVRAQARA